MRLRLLNLANRLSVESTHFTFFIYLNTKPVVLWTRAPTYDRSKDKKEAKRKTLKNSYRLKGRNVKKNISPGYISLTGIRFVVIVFFGLPLILALIDHTMGACLSFELLFVFPCCCCRVISSPFSS